MNETDPSVGQDQTPAPATTPAAGGQSWTLNGIKVPQQFIDILYPGYRIEGDQLVWRGTGIPPTLSQSSIDYLKPFSDAYQAGDWKGLFNAVMGSYGAGSQKDILNDPSARQRLEAFGFNISPANASGETSKIQVPGGNWTRVITGDPNSNNWTYDWVDEGNGTQGGTQGSVSGPAPYVGAVPAGFGTPPPPFVNPALPAALQTPYALPTQADVEAMPGYQTGLNTGKDLIQRSAAAKGSILNGGTLEALDRFGQDYGQNFYGTAVSQGLSARNQNLGEYQTDLGNRYNQYMTNYGIAHTAQNDYWSRLQDLYGIGASTATASKPAGA